MRCIIGGDSAVTRPNLDSQLTRLRANSAISQLEQFIPGTDRVQLHVLA
jgi:hypothetical protein